MKKWMYLWLASLAIVAGAENLSPLTVVSVAGKSILANASGLTVYTYDPDKPGVSNCNGGCAKAWPPVLVASGTVLTAPLGVTIRQDGTTQVTYEGHPVYTYVGDSASGQTNGDGLGGIWHIVTE